MVDAVDPKRKWKRKEYNLNTLNGLTVRQRSELETDRDLDKCVEQLVCDVHEETHNQNRQPLDNIACAQKRMVSLMARVALSNDRVSKRILVLTWVIVGMTLIMVILNLIIVFKK